MAVKKIITAPDLLLRKKSKPVKKIRKKTKQLVKDLIDSAKAQREPEGVGLSAIQIGQPTRIFVALLDGKFTEFINPKVIKRSKIMFSQKVSKDKHFMEGCLSVPGYFALVDRPHSVTFKWQDLGGKTHERKFSDRQSAYVQHELDHLNGVLFTDRALKQKQKIYRIEKNSSNEEELIQVEL